MTEKTQIFFYLLCACAELLQDIIKTFLIRRLMATVPSELTHNAKPTVFKIVRSSDM